jgi:23S rRNA (guanosine2251-2'-O)-methyltransferase
MKIIYGFHAVNAYILNGDINLIKALYLSNKRNDNRINELIDTCNKKQINYLLQEQKFLNKFCNENHQGVILILNELKINKIKINDLNKLTKNSIIIILDGITDPHNLGAILRSSECFGVNAIVVPKDNSANVSNEIIAKVSCGAIYNVPILEVTNLSRTIDDLKDLGYWIFGTTLGENTISLYDLEYNNKIAIVFGNEGKGIRRLIKDNCDYLLKIPLLGSTQSLNVSVAAGIVLSHLNYIFTKFG